MIKKKLARAIALTMTGSALSLAAATDASAATTMYNRYNANVNGVDGSGNALPCAPCIGPANSAGSFTDGWVWGTPTAASGYVGPTSGGSATAATPGWVGTSGATTTPFAAYTAAPSLNWGFRLTSATDSGQISNADAISRYNVSADIDTAAGGWFDNASTGGQGWLHDVDIGLFRSDVSTPVSLSVAGVNNVGSNFGITVFKGMSGNTTGYVHHGSWNTGQNGSPLPTGGDFGGDDWGFTPADIVATTDTSGSPVNLNQLVFNAEAGQIYTIVLGGWKDGTWYDTKDGYVLDVAAVPVPAAVWLFGSALAGMGIVGRRKSQTAS